jgi:hypothetical protein
VPARPDTLIVGALGIGAVAAIAGAVTAAAHRGSPVRIDGVERTDTWAALFLALVAVAFLLYVCALVVLHTGQQTVAVVAVVAVAIQLTPLAGPLLISRDVYSYWASGRVVAVHDANPFTTVPATFPQDPATRAAAWREQTSVYGPVFALASAAVAGVGGRSAESTALAFRAIAAGAGIAATVLAAMIARRKAFAAAFLGWNPIVALSFAGGGHNDAWMLVLLLAALALAARKRDFEGGVLWVLAAAIKAPAFALLLLQLPRSRRGLGIGAALAAVVSAAVATVVFGPAWLAAGSQLAGRETRVGLPARLEQLGVAKGVAHTLAYATLAAGCLWLARRVTRGRPSLALGSSMLVVSSAWVLPWYATWPVALAAVEEDALSQVVALGLALYLLFDRIPH